MTPLLFLPTDPNPTHRPNRLFLFALGFLFLLFVTDAPMNQFALWGLLITTAAGVVNHYLDNQRDVQRRRDEAEERERDRVRLAEKIDENTELTKATLEAAQKTPAK